MTQFTIGEIVYQAVAGPERVWITCPECLGSGRLRVLLGDDSEVSIACVCCERGYEGSPGRIQTYEFRAGVEPRTVSGFSVSRQAEDTSISYSFRGNWCGDDSDTFATPAEAALHAVILAKDHQVEEIKRLKFKEKQHKTWAWNVAYFRGQIRRAKKDIANYEARLAVAPKNPKKADKLAPPEAL